MLSWYLRSMLPPGSLALATYSSLPWHDAQVFSMLLWCVRDAATSLIATIKRGFGSFLLWFAPKLMKFLSVAGTAAMFLVGGHILVEGIAVLHHFGESLHAKAFGTVLSMLFDLVVGIVTGAIVLAGVAGVQKLRGKLA